MEKPEKELIKEIANLFEDYEEAYVPGEWESFNKKRDKRKYPFVLPLLKIAAVLLLCASILPFIIPQFNTSRQKKEQVAASKALQRPVDSAVVKISPDVPEKRSDQLATSIQGPKLPAAASSVEKNPVGLQRETVLAPLSARVLPAFRGAVPSLYKTSKMPQKLISSAQILPVPNQNITAPEIVVAQLQTSPKALRKDTAQLNPPPAVSTIDFLAAESRQSTKDVGKKEQPSKWDFGLELAPAMTRTNMNFGGGLTTAYRLSDKFSISSGLSLLQLQSATDVAPSAQSKMAVSSLSTKELQAIDANIKAIDIPLAIVYHLNKNFYTSAGISYFNVISEKRSNTYQQASASVQSVANPVTGYASDVRTVITQSVLEPALENNLKGNSYLGFFNFSIGRKQNIFNKYNVIIEPFIKIPVGKLSTQDLNLTNSGLKFQFNF